MVVKQSFTFCVNLWSTLFEMKQRAKISERPHVRLSGCAETQIAACAFWQQQRLRIALSSFGVKMRGKDKQTEINYYKKQRLTGNNNN